METTFERESRFPLQRTYSGTGFFHNKLDSLAVIGRAIHETRERVKKKKKETKKKQQTKTNEQTSKPSRSAGRHLEFDFGIVDGSLIVIHRCLYGVAGIKKNELAAKIVSEGPSAQWKREKTPTFLFGKHGSARPRGRGQTGESADRRRSRRNHRGRTGAALERRK